ncbi:MAG: hypothetical protein WA622_16670 [Mycobacterium sp.]|uniref:hypothetical protein n=1 Tax=Mycobacterium sp. TaxID=1785 RepID=UPI003BB707D2
MHFEAAISTPEIDAHRLAQRPVGHQPSGSTVAGMTRADDDDAGAPVIEELRR